MANRALHGYVGATGGDLQLGDYPLGSIESRAAVRALLDAQFAGQKMDVIVTLVGSGSEWTEDCRIGEWKECENGSLIRMSYLPEDMTIEEAERVVAVRG